MFTRRELLKCLKDDQAWCHNCPTRVIRSGRSWVVSGLTECCKFDKALVDAAKLKGSLDTPT